MPNLNLINQKFKTGLQKFARNQRAMMDMKKLMDVMIIVIMIPIFMSMFTGLATTGNETTDTMITAITGILPLFLLFDVFSGLTGKRKN
ncbi:MAG: hypothetical protein NWF01_08785 [Candidatus Bathyarchaeota archaeon]|nr:hypothetical protein [Candidatus Bathyarchaeota archaeon]